MYKQFASGYLVKDGKVLLVHHNKFDKWTPPGGHMEEDETPADTVVREFKEETSLDVRIIPAYPSAFAGDSNTTSIPLPFHMDLEREGFDVPHIGHFFYVKLARDGQEMNHQVEELHGIQWFIKVDLVDLKTFDQVRAVARFAIDNYPKSL
jgi:8-oxo-dGTP pyrophosphatase MutT (NUDIX family)